MPLVAHITDLHLLSLKGVSPLALLNKRLTGAANLLFNRAGQFPLEVAHALIQDVKSQNPDHVVVSGDVSNLSLDPEFALVGEVLGGLDMPPERVTVVPGNHDYYTGSAAKEEAFSKALGRYLCGDLQPGPGHFPQLKLATDGLAVLALSSARVSAPLLAVGTLGTRQLRLAEQLLLHPACEDRFRLVVLHHPLGGPHVSWGKRLTDAAAFKQMLRRVGAELVVHGHLHRFIRNNLPGPLGEIPVQGCASSTWLSPKDVDRRAQYLLYEVEGLDLVGLRMRRFDPAEGAFFEAPLPELAA